MEFQRENVFKKYFSVPFVLGLLLVALTVALYFWNIRFGIISTGVTFIYYGAALLQYVMSRKQIMSELAYFGESFSRLQNQMIHQMHTPFLIAGRKGEVLWQNKAFREIFNTSGKQFLLENMFPELNMLSLNKIDSLHIQYNDRYYLLQVTPLDMSVLEEKETENRKTPLYNVSFVDETDVLRYQDELECQRTVVLLIYLDNYEEVMGGVEYVRRSLLAALVERKLNKYITNSEGVIVQMERDRYLAVINRENLQRLEEEKFSLLEDIKSVNIGNEMPMTISMGIGADEHSISGSYSYARAAVDIALGRGGDQAVFKDSHDVKYYGGKIQGQGSLTRVKARVKARALRELIEAREQVLIMGHPISDLDCIGAAVGIYRVAKFSGKKAHIILDRTSTSVEPILATFKDNKEYEPDMFVDTAKGLNLYNNDTLLVVLDTNRKSYTACPDLLKKASGIVVMDHHRQSKDFIENAVLSYIEPYASSASELVAEMIQYYDESIKLRPSEADALFAGIVMDTNNFEDKSGVRTFEAAAYLRRSGADVTRVRKIFRDTMEDYKLRAETISKATVFDEEYIIGICPQGSDDGNQTVVAAQAANELLEIRGIKASFVLTEYNKMVYLSARSIDEVNVQVMMEKLGGGGHLSVAGAQFKNITIEEALEKLKEVIREYDKSQKK